MIRLAMLSDIEALLPLLESFHKRAKLKRFAMFEDSVEFWQSFIARCIENERAVCLVAEKDDGLAGFITAGLTQAFWNPNVTFVTETTWWVDPGVRGMGVGRALLSTVEEWAKLHGVLFASAGTSSGIGHKATGGALRKMGYTLEEKIYMKRLEG